MSDAPRGDWVDQLLVGSCPPDLQQELGAEVEVLVRSFAPDADPVSLRSAAAVLDAYADLFDVGRGRMKLWGAALRLMASDARPPEDPSWRGTGRGIS